MSEQTTSDSANVQQIIASDHGGRIDVPGDPAALLRADFVRDGADLIIVGPDGPIAEIVGYFAGGVSPDLNMGVAVLPARTISILAGPDAGPSALTPTPVAATARAPEPASTTPDDQAARIRPETEGTSASDPEAQSAPIATVEDMTGEVWVIRFDGSRVALEIGMPVYQEDTVVTGEQATVGLRFVDDMSFSLGNDARMVLEEFHYEPDTGDGGGLISVVQGAFSFVSGRAAKAHEDALQIEMPTMTIGVRGTKVAGFAAAEGEKSRVALLAEDDGTVGKIMVSTDGGSYLITDANTMVESISRYMEPLPPVQISTDVMHDYFSSALTILPTAAPKPGQETKLQQLDFDSLNDAATDSRVDVKKATFDEMAPEAVPVKAAAEAAPAAAPASAPKPKPVVETAPAEATKPAAAAVVSNTTEEEEELVEETGSEESSSAPPAPPPPANAAPVLDTTGAPALAAIAEDAAAPAGTIVSNLVIDGSITDADGTAVEAIALVGADNANGTWQYSLDDGATYQAVGAVAPGSALLLDGDALLRFVPSADYNGTATLSYKAWDMTTGTSGDRSVDTTSGTAFSAATESASIVVTAVNDAPVLDTSGAPSLTTIVEDIVSPAGETVASLVGGSITDADGSAQNAIAVVGVDDSNGTWEFKPNGSGAYSAIGPVSETSALLLGPGDKIRFVPNADYNGTATISYKAWDRTTGSDNDTGVDTTVGTAFSSATESASITVTSVNDKPVLDTSGTPTLSAIAEDAAAPAGETVASLVTGTITDADGIPLEAIAVTGVDDANGTWQYSLDAGLTYSAIGAVSETASLLLGPTALLRFVPDSDYNGTATISYKAWDMAVGASGDSGVNSQAGTAFSVATETASITVTPANDAPELDTSGMPTLSAIVENTAAPAGDTVASIVVDGSVTDADGAAVEAIAVTAVDDTNGTWQYSLDGGATFAAIGPVTPTTALLLDATALVRFVPNASYNGTATFSYKAWDVSAGASGDTGVNTLVGTAFSNEVETASITIDPGNNAPDLDTSGSPTLTAIAEDDSAPTGDTVASIVVDGSITDPDGAAVESIAVTAVDDTNGTWQYSTDGGATFSAIGAVAPDSALLLASTAIIRFVPDGDYNGGATFSYKAWDMSAGANGDSAVDTTVGSAFSNEVDTASVTVTAVNDAPVLDTSGAPTLSAIAENNATSSGNTVASIVIDGSITDVDGAVEAIAVTGVDDSNGTWEYSLDSGATFTAIGAVSDSAALLLDGTAVIRFVPDADYNGSATFSFKAWDGSTGSSGDSGVDTTVGTAFSAAVESASIAIVNGSNTPDFASGSEVRVNTETTDAQSSPAIAALGDGGYVIVWESKAQDSDDFGVYAQRYDAQGVAVGSEFQVNTTTTKAQQNPSVTELADGGFVVIWQSKDQDGSNWGVYGQRFDSDGTATGGEFQVNSSTYNEQMNPSVTALSDGSFVVVWESKNGGDWGVYGQKYNADGSSAGSEFSVRSRDDEEHVSADVEALAGGGFVVVWQSKGDEAYSTEVSGQIYAADGTKVGGKFQVNSYSYKDQGEPSVAALADGGFVVVWQSKDQDGSIQGIYGQRYDSSGNPVEFEFEVNTTTSQEQEAPSVTALDDGGFLVSWQSKGQEGPNYGIYAQRYNADGDAIGTEFRINTTTANDQTAPATITLDNGAVVAVWQSDNQDGSGAGIYAHHYQTEAASANSAPISAGASMLDLDGFNEYVDVGDPGGDDLDLKTGDLTVEAWFYYGGPSAGDQMIVSKGNDWHGDMGFSIHLNNGDLVARVNSGGSTNAADTAATGIAMPAEPGWYHVAMVINQEAGFGASSVTGYLNGSNAGWSDGYGSVSNDIFTSQSGGTNTGDNFVIGAVDTGLGRSEHFDGQIADVRVWNTARSQADIQADMSRTLDGDEANLIGNWQLDDGAGTTAANAVAGGASGTLYGGAGWQSTTSYTMSVDGELDGRVTANDADGDTLSFSVGTGPTNGTASINATTGAWEYTPNAGYSGTDSVSFQVTDGSETDIVTVAIQIA